MEREVVSMEERIIPKNEVFRTTVALVNQKAKILSIKIKVPVSFDPFLVSAGCGVLEKLVQPTLSKIPSPG